MKIKIDARSEIVGILDEQVYITKRIKHKHFFRKFEGWGISLDILEKHKIDKIVVESDVGRFVTTPQDLMDFGHTFDNYGDIQKVLPLAEWKTA